MFPPKYLKSVTAHDLLRSITLKFHETVALLEHLDVCPRAVVMYTLLWEDPTLTHLKVKPVLLSLEEGGVTWREVVWREEKHQVNLERNQLAERLATPPTRTSFMKQSMREQALQFRQWQVLGK